MSAKTILSRGYQMLRQSLGGFQSDARGGLACPHPDTAWNWPGVGEFDARQLRDIGLPAQATAPKATPQLYQDLCPHRLLIDASPYFGFGAGL